MSECILSPSAWEMYLTFSLGTGLQVGFTLAHVGQKLASDLRSNSSPKIIFCSINHLITVGEMWPIFWCSSSTVCTLTPIYVPICPLVPSSTQYRPWYWGILPICSPLVSFIQQDLSFMVTVKLAALHFANETRVYPKSGLGSTTHCLTLQLCCPFH